MKRCSKCILPENFPAITFDNNGICSYCSDEKNSIEYKAQLQKRRIKKRDEMLRTFQRIRGKYRYDCMLGLSGGKDSTALLYILKKEYGLNVLAVTMDTGFLSKIAVENVKRATKLLEVDHITFSPNPMTYKRIYKHLILSLKKDYVKTICNMCGKLTHGVSFDLAYNLKIPLIMGAHSPYQGSGVGIFPYRRLMSKGWRNSPRKFLSNELYEEMKAYLWDPFKHLFAFRLPKLYFPFHLLDYNVDSIIKKIRESDLILPGNEDTLVTNCQMCYLMILLDRKKTGYNPFVGEFSCLVRNGQYNREVCLKKFEQVEKDIEENKFHTENITHALSKLDLSLDTLLKE